MRWWGRGVRMGGGGGGQRGRWAAGRGGVLCPARPARFDRGSSRLFREAVRGRLKQRRGGRGGAGGERGWGGGGRGERGWGGAMATSRAAPLARSGGGCGRSERGRHGPPREGTGGRCAGSGRNRRRDLCLDAEASPPLSPPPRSPRHHAGSRPSPGWPARGSLGADGCGSPVRRSDRPPGPAPRKARPQSPRPTRRRGERPALRRHGCVAPAALNPCNSPRPEDPAAPIAARTCRPGRCRRAHTVLRAARAPRPEGPIGARTRRPTRRRARGPAAGAAGSGTRPPSPRLPRRPGHPAPPRHPPHLRPPHPPPLAPAPPRGERGHGTMADTTGPMRVGVRGIHVRPRSCPSCRAWVRSMFSVLRLPVERGTGDRLSGAAAASHDGR